MSQQCPFCRFNIPDGAVVCGHCHAVKKRKPPSDFKGNFCGALLLGQILALFLWFKTHIDFADWILITIFSAISGIVLYIESGKEWWER